MESQKFFEMLRDRYKAKIRDLQELKTEIENDINDEQLLQIKYDKQKELASNVDLYLISNKIDLISQETDHTKEFLKILKEISYETSSVQNEISIKEEQLNSLLNKGKSLEIPKTDLTKLLK